MKPDLDALLTRQEVAVALTANGFPTSAATLATRRREAAVPRFTITAHVRSTGGVTRFAGPKVGLALRCTARPKQTRRNTAESFGPPIYRAGGSPVSHIGRNREMPWIASIPPRRAKAVSMRGSTSRYGQTMVLIKRSGMLNESK